MADEVVEQKGREYAILLEQGKFEIVHYITAHGPDQARELFRKLLNGPVDTGDLPDRVAACDKVHAIVATAFSRGVAPKKSTLTLYEFGEPEVSEPEEEEDGNSNEPVGTGE